LNFNNLVWSFPRVELLLESQQLGERTGIKNDHSGNKNSLIRAAVNRSNLAEAYHYAVLPPVTLPKQLSPGERRILKVRKLTTYVKELFTPDTVSPRKRTPSKKSLPKGRQPYSLF